MTKTCPLCDEVIDQLPGHLEMDCERAEDIFTLTDKRYAQ